MIEVLKQALDALETEVSIDWTNNDEFNASAEKMHDAITSLRQAIAEAEKQEQPLPPVEIGVDVTADGASIVAFYRRPNAVMEMFYSQFHPAPQRTWVGLTNNELQPIADEYRILFGGWVEDFARAIEAKLKEKNT